MRRSSTLADSVSIFAGVSARANSRSDATRVVWSLVRRLRIQLISVLNGSRLCIAMKPTIGAFHFGASRRSTESARLTARALRGARRDDGVFVDDAIRRSTESIYHMRTALISFARSPLLQSDVLHPDRTAGPRPT